jgi:hypothetical protein
MQRREFLKSAAIGAAMISVVPATLTLTGCSAQSETTALLNELETAFTSFETTLGKAVPVSVTNAFAAAIAAVKAWVPGTASQSVVEALQLLSTSVLPLLAGVVNPIEIAAGQLVLGTVVNLIELIDPAAVPPVATAALRSHVVVAQITVTNATLYHEAHRLKVEFERNWLVTTGRKAA